MKASNEMKSLYKISERQCFFDDEKTLMFFKIYSKSNCELECLTNITWNECGCVLYWMPRNISTTKMCGINDYNCYSKTAYQYLNINIATASYDPTNRYDIPYKCNCLPRCNSVTYFAEEKDPNSQLNIVNEDESDEDEDEDEEKQILINMHEIPNAIVDPENDTSLLKNDGNDTKDVDLLDLFNIDSNESSRNFNSKQLFEEDNIHRIKTVQLTIEFQKSQFLAMSRLAAYGVSDFIADCGGLLGLFMGLSFLSVVEVIYFATIRLILILKTKRRQK